MALLPKFSVFLQHFLILFMLLSLCIFLDAHAFLGLQQVMVQNKTTSTLQSKDKAISSVSNKTCTITINAIAAPSNTLSGLTFTKNTTLYIGKDKSNLPPTRYNITGDNLLSNITAQKDNDTYIVNVFSRSNGSLKIELPLNALVAAINSAYLVSDNKHILSCAEVKDTPQARILDIGFVNGTQRIKIIGNRFIDLSPKAIVSPNLQTVNQNSTVKLDGSKSYDLEGGPLIYNWTQIAGKPVILNGANRAIATFNATTGVSNDTFTLTVRNPANLTDSASENLIVRNIALRPTPTTGVNATQAFHAIVDSALPYFFMIIIALVMIIPLGIDMFLAYRKKPMQSTTDRENKSGVIGMSGLYRTLMTFGVILLVGAVLFYILLLITLNVNNFVNPALQSLIDVFKNLATILGTALATIIAFYFGMKGSEDAKEKGAAAATKTTTKDDNDNNKTPPKIIGTSPGDGENDVPIDSPVTNSFSKRMDTSTINSTTFNVKKDGTTTNIPATIHTSPDGKTAILSTRSNFDPNTKYIATIDIAVKDELGNALASPKSWSFRTKA
jgi:hypothetical protein